MIDPFDALGMSPAFDLDLIEAERRHLELSKTLHPDRYAGRPAAERRQALGKAIEVNEAWRKLRDPVQRAEALLSRLGLAVEEGNEPKADPGLLMEMMEQREELAGAARTRDESRIAALVANVTAREKRALTALAESFDAALSAENGSRAALAEPIWRRLGELRYLRRFLDEARALQDEIY